MRRNIFSEGFSAFKASVDFKYLAKYLIKYFALILGWVVAFLCGYLGLKVYEAYTKSGKKGCTTNNEETKQ